jgi:hypothetical protein
LIAGCSGNDSNQSLSSSSAAEAATAADAVEVATAPKQEQPATRSGWPPSEACSFLAPALVTRGYKHDFDDEY